MAKTRKVGIANLMILGRVAGRFDLKGMKRYGLVDPLATLDVMGRSATDADLMATVVDGVKLKIGKEVAGEVPLFHLGKLKLCVFQ